MSTQQQPRQPRSEQEKAAELAAATELGRIINSAEFLTELSKSLPGHVKPEKFVRAATNQLREKPSLALLDRQSFYVALHKAAAQGLLPDGREGAIVPKKGKAVFWEMIAGKIKQVWNSGMIEAIAVEVVFEKDKFRFWVDTDGPQIEHLIEAFSDRGNALGAYAMVKIRGGGVMIETMSKAEIMDVKAVSPGGEKDDSPWNTAFVGEMWRKTVFNRIEKKLPSSTHNDYSASGGPEDETPTRPLLVEGQVTAGEVPSKPAAGSRLQALTESAVSQPGPPMDPSEVPL